MVTPKTKHAAIALMRGANPPSLAEISKQLKVPVQALEIWRRADRLMQASTAAPVAPVVAPSTSAEVERLTKLLEERDSEIAALKDTVAGLSALLVKRG